MQRVWIYFYDRFACQQLCQSLSEYGLQAQSISGGFQEIFQRLEAKEPCDAIVMQVTQQNVNKAVHVRQHIGGNGFCKSPLFFALTAENSPALWQLLQEADFCEILGLPIGEYFLAQRLMIQMKDQQQRWQLQRQKQRKQCRALLLQVGCPCDMRGFDYLLECLLLVMEHPDYLRQLTKEIYPEAARRMRCSPSALERGIRTMLQSCAARSMATMRQMASCENGSEPTGKANTAEFLTLARVILEQQAQ